MGVCKEGCEVHLPQTVAPGVVVFHCEELCSIVAGAHASISQSVGPKYLATTFSFSCFCPNVTTCEAEFFEEEPVHEAAYFGHCHAETRPEKQMYELRRMVMR